ncbi:MAG: hypothetical protein LBF62_01925 [Tannerellaceae bacterium]|jgi:hypothetical protein|nr:hypothetical protein [Tannerellaceae bacterium]
MPKKNIKNILGLRYQFNPNERWQAIVFIKEILQHSTAPIIQDDIYILRKNDINKTGYGFAGTYWPLLGLQIKLSYEKCMRLPENEELFGDEVICSPQIR